MAGYGTVSSVGGAGGGVAVSAGANSQSTGTVIFSNLNGVSFGLDAGTLTASVVGAAPGSISAGTTNVALGEVVFSNSNGVSFGLNGSTVTATVQTNYLTTAMASNRGSDFVAATAAFAGTNASGTIASNGISVSVGPYITTGALSNHSHGVTANNGGFNFQTLSFSNANGISFGTSAGSAITGSHNALTSQSNQAFSADASSTFQTLTFQDSNGISFSNNAGALRVTHALQFTSNTSAITSNAMHSTSRPAFSADASSTFQTLTFQNSNNVSFSNNAGAIRVTHNLAGTGTAITGGALITLNSTGLSFNGSGLAGTGTALNLTNLTGTLNVNSAGVSISMSAAAPGAAAITQTVGISNVTAGGSTAGTTGGVTGDDIQFVFVPGSNITMSQSINGSSGTLSIYGPAAGGGNTCSFIAFPPTVGGTQTLSFAQSTSYAIPFALVCNYSVGTLRAFVSGSMAASSTATTIGNTSFSMSAVTTHNLVLYSRGVGANSLSLQSIGSTGQTDQQLFTLSAAANSTQFSYSNRLTIGTLSVTKDYSSSAASLNFHTSNLTDLSGAKLFDINFATSLTPGQYWLVYGRSTTSATQNAAISVATRMLVSHNTFLAVSQNTLALGVMGAATNSSVGFTQGLGSFTTAGGGSTNSIPLANISTTASHNHLIFELVRIA